MEWERLLQGVKTRVGGGGMGLFKARQDGDRCCSRDGMVAGSDPGHAGVGAHKWAPSVADRQALP
jgi:hypothetical protein